MNYQEEAVTLWEETIEALKKHGKDWENVYWICIGNYRMHKDDFEKYAKKIFYRPWLFGGNTISLKLRLYGFKFVLTRWEYDGSEGWNFLETEPPSDYTMTKDAKVLFEELAWNYSWRKDFEKEN